MTYKEEVIDISKEKMIELGSLPEIWKNEKQ